MRIYRKHTIYIRVRCVNQNNGLSWDLWVSCGNIINYLRLNCYTRPLETIKLINELQFVWVKEGWLNCENLKIKFRILTNLLPLGNPLRFYI